VLFDSNYPKDWAQSTYAHEQTLIKLGIQDPTLGLYSSTYSSQGVTFNATLASGLQDIVTGRRPVTDYDQLVKDWRAAGGDKARSEYEAALATAG
jgi:putative aldouronate transport system substrate-binding protein